MDSYHVLFHSFLFPVHSAIPWPGAFPYFGSVPWPFLHFPSTATCTQTLEKPCRWERKPGFGQPQQETAPRGRGANRPATLTAESHHTTGSCSPAHPGSSFALPKSGAVASSALCHHHRCTSSASPVPCQAAVPGTPRDLVKNHPTPSNLHWELWNPLPHATGEPKGSKWGFKICSS